MRLHFYKNTFEFGDNVKYNGDRAEFTCNYFAFNGVFHNDDEVHDYLLDSAAKTDILNQNTSYFWVVKKCFLYKIFSFFDDFSNKLSSNNLCDF